MAYELRDGFVCIWIGCGHVWWRHIPDELGKLHCEVSGCPCILGGFMRPELMFRPPTYRGPDKINPPKGPISG